MFGPHILSSHFSEPEFPHRCVDNSLYCRRIQLRQYSCQHPQLQPCSYGMGSTDHKRALYEPPGILLRQCWTGNINRLRNRHCSNVCGAEETENHSKYKLTWRFFAYRPWLRRLQMPLRQKLAVGAILAMGCL